MKICSQHYLSAEKTHTWIYKQGLCTKHFKHYLSNKLNISGTGSARWLSVRKKGLVFTTVQKDNVQGVTRLHLVLQKHKKNKVKVCC